MSENPSRVFVGKTNVPHIFLLVSVYLSAHLIPAHGHSYQPIFTKCNILYFSVILTENRENHSEVFLLSFGQMG